MTERVYVSKGDVVTDSLREMITRGDLAPGELLRQRSIAEQFNVSPTPVREALRRLESEGLVSHDVHRGARVATFDVDEQEENYRILAALESLATSLAVEKLTDADIDDIREIERAFAKARADDPDAKALNWDFHFRIYECARSPLLLALMRLLWRSFPRGPQEWRPHDESVDQHRMLVASLAHRDAERAATITREHVLGSIDWMRSRLSSDGR
jgi:DNA-binding GntR family transcriptional regulator